MAIGFKNSHYSCGNMTITIVSRRKTNQPNKTMIILLVLKKLSSTWKN